MILKHSDLQIPEHNPFENCKLNREQYANILTSVVSTYADGFVLAINNEWGAGKTTFVKMWQAQLKLNGFHTLYFNAWENDYESNPLVPLMYELKSLSGEGNEETFKSLLKKGGKITKSIFPGIIKAVADKYIDSDAIVDIIKNSAEAGMEILQEEIEAYAEKKKGLVEFKEELTKFISETDGSKPIVFIIDELDRCRPNYAVEVLEQVKHFFSVEGIAFVLSIDKVQLGHAIKGVYGSEKIDSEEYLRRFIDIEYSIPKPNTEAFCKYLFDYFDFDKFFLNEERVKYRDLQRDKYHFNKITPLLFETSNLTLRQQEKVFAHSRLVLNSFNANHYMIPSLFIFLVYAKTHHPEFYKKIEEKSYTLGGLLKDFANVISVSADMNEEDAKPFVQLETYLLWFYKTYIDDKINMVEIDVESNEITTPFTSCLDSSENQSHFKGMLRFLSDDFDMRSMTIEHLLKKISLTEPLNL